MIAALLHDTDDIKIFETTDCQPSINMDETEYRNNEGTTINHFYEKLLLIKDMMNTDCAKVIANKRDGYMREFLKEFYDEWNEQ